MRVSLLADTEDLKLIQEELGNEADWNFDRWR